MGQAYAEAVGILWSAGPGPADPGRQAIVDRAVGLLAGRARCRVAEAHRYLLRMAAEQHRDLAEAAAAVVRALDRTDLSAAGEELYDLTAMAAQAPRPESKPAPFRRFEPWLAMVQRVLDVLPGMTGYLTAERDPHGQMTDLICAAASPGALAPRGVRGTRLVGLRVSTDFPEVFATDRWAVYQDVLETGCPATLGPFILGPFSEGTATITVHAHRLGQGLLLNWSGHEARDGKGGDDRLAATERLGNLGWGEWNLATGELYWSPQLYRIYERDPALGPPSVAESRAAALPDDESLRLAAQQAFERSERVDLITRVKVNGRIKHLRTVADAERDTRGEPLRLYGIVQDVTDQETSAQRLAEVERELDEQRRAAAADHELAERLQHVILPLPDDPIDLPGLQVAVRYVPAGRQSSVGGDWYHAAELRDGGVLLAVGDVAGHGTQAAATMAQLRHALRALAITTSDPGELLGHLNRLACDLQRETPELAATAVVARFDPGRRELLWAQAGHPPPLLTRDGRTATLGRPPGHMLGVVDDTTYPTARIDFRDDDVLLLYTDGLVEHRGRGLDEGLWAAMHTMDECASLPLAHLLGRLRQANPDDDTCILAARPL